MEVKEVAGMHAHKQKTQCCTCNPDNEFEEEEAVEHDLNNKAWEPTQVRRQEYTVDYNDPIYNLIKFGMLHNSV